MQLKWSQLKGSSSGKFGDLPITQKEVLPVVLACAVWGREWNKRQVVVHCDNEAAVVVLNSGYSRDPHIMHLLRALFFIKAWYQIDMTVCHISGKVNTVADAISRDNLALLHLQVPSADPRPVEIPCRLLQVLVEQQPDWTSVDWVHLFRSCFQRV